MDDLLAIGFMICFFALTWGLLRWCSLLGNEDRKGDA